MTSNINPAFPDPKKPTTASVRENFQAAKDEIEALQSAVSDLQLSGGGGGGSSEDNTVFAATAGANLTAYRPVVPTSSGVVHGDAGDASHAGRVVGIITTSPIFGQSVYVRVAGEITNPGWSWDVTKPVFLAAGGGLTQVIPTTSTSAFSQVVGLPTTQTSMIVTLELPTVLS